MGKTQSHERLSSDLELGPSPHAWGKLVVRIDLRPVLVPDHPHTRGENASGYSSRVDRRTIPTRVGKTAIDAREVARCRTIPTRVGKTAQLVAAERRRDQRGPPPHAWGKRSAAARPSTPCRTTPTRVGKTVTRPERRHGRTTPTRVGKTASMLQRASVGPPPHAWGKLHAESIMTAIARRTTPTRVGKTRRCQASGGCDVRTTPTRVGKTDVAAGNRHARCADHPHTRGENAASWQSTLADSYVRTTPTRVGKTSMPSRCTVLDCGPPPHAWGKRRCSHTVASAASSVHPHTRGENALTDACDRVDRRSTPTRVGKTDALRSAQSDHPHTRGENSGPSTLARRTIPTRVGKTPTACARSGTRDGPPPHAWGKLPYVTS